MMDITLAPPLSRLVARVANDAPISSAELGTLTRAARTHGHMARWNMDVAIQRGPTHVWATTAEMFLQDAYAHARLAFRLAEARRVAGARGPSQSRVT